MADRFTGGRSFIISFSLAVQDFKFSIHYINNSEWKKESVPIKELDIVYCNVRTALLHTIA